MNILIFGFPACTFANIIRFPYGIHLINVIFNSRLECFKESTFEDTEKAQ